MTLNTSINKTSDAGNGSTTAFSFPYLFFADNDLVVTLVVDATGVETTQTLTTDYTVAGAGNTAGGTVTMVTAPAVGETLVIQRIEQFSQGLDLVENDPMPSDNTEKQLDILTMLTQQLNEGLTRAIKLPVSNTGDGVLGPLTANYIMTINSTKDGVTLLDPSSLSTSVAYATMVTDTFNGDGSTVAFTLSSDPSVEANTMVFVENVYQTKSSYSLTGTTLTFNAAPPTGTNNIEVVHGTAVEAGTAASTTVLGAVELATDAEVTTGTDTARAVTPAGLHQKTASATAVGLVELATDAETVTGTDTARSTTPANITAKMSAPGPIGDTTPSTGAFTTLTANTLDTGQGANELYAMNQDVETTDSVDFAAVGAGTPGTGAFTTLSTTGDISVGGNINKASGTLGIQTGGTNRLEAFASGNIGAVTNLGVGKGLGVEPSVRLDIQQSADTEAGGMRLWDAAGANRAGFHMDSSNQLRGSLDGTDLLLMTTLTLQARRDHAGGTSLWAINLNGGGFAQAGVQGTGGSVVLQQGAAGGLIYGAGGGALSVYNSGANTLRLGANGQDDDLIIDTSHNVTVQNDLSAETISGGVIATQAEQETGTATDHVVTPAVQHHHDSACKVWASINGMSGTVAIGDSYNLTSVSDGGVGILTFTFDTDFSSEEYAWSASCESNAGATVHVVVGESAQQLAGSCKVQIQNLSATNVDPLKLSFMAFGDQ